MWHVKDTWFEFHIKQFLNPILKNIFQTEHIGLCFRKSVATGWRGGWANGWRADYISKVLEGGKNRYTHRSSF